MRVLLDTHVLIWWDEGRRLSRAASDAIKMADQVYVSAVSAWEIALKTSLGRLAPIRTVAGSVAENGFEELPVRFEHAVALATLPWHHRDPFDRMLIAQASAERLTIVTRDAAFDDYRPALIRA